MAKLQIPLGIYNRSFLSQVRKEAMQMFLGMIDTGQQSIPLTIAPNLSLERDGKA
jgi:hypothetical protein